MSHIFLLLQCTPGFKGELKDWRKGTTIAVKTHNSNPKHISEFKAVILIIRNPYNALIAEHNRQFGGDHVGFAPESKRKGKGKARRQIDVNEHALCQCVSELPVKLLEL